ASPTPPILLRLAGLCLLASPEEPGSATLPCCPRRAPPRPLRAPARTRGARLGDQSLTATDRPPTCTTPAASQAPTTDSTSIACKQSGCALWPCFRRPTCGRPGG